MVISLPWHLTGTSLQKICKTFKDSSLSAFSDSCQNKTFPTNFNKVEIKKVTTWKKRPYYIGFNCLMLKNSKFWTLRATWIHVVSWFFLFLTKALNSELFSILGQGYVLSISKKLLHMLDNNGLKYFYLHSQC